MCGIAGFVLDRRNRSEQELEGIREDFATLLAATEIRGRDAAGAFVLKQGVAKYLKQPGPASRLVAQPQFWQLLDAVDNDTVGVVGHTRWATHGDPADNRNNHPLLAGPILGVHNGVIYNYRQLRAEVGATAEVDSEVIFRLLRRHSNGRVRPRGIRKALARLRGDYAIAFADLRLPAIWLCRNHRPLVVAKDMERGALWFGSQADLLRSVLGEDVEVRALKPCCGYQATRDNCLKGLAGFELAERRPHQVSSKAIDFLAKLSDGCV
ncbi:MAG TPA: hypothetical protein G4O03_01780 [Dehalococcoidia bacterium]|jgi:glucosamine 6-phosphate synthetase-like amidotransferase/phosphosugar isomerase protein|nr:hypothetical protein [Dehalococcoidia bacterium]